MDWEIVKGWEAILGMVTGVIGLVTGAIYWIGQRLKSRDEGLSKQIKAARTAEGERIDALDAEVKGLKTTVGEIDRRVEAIERKLETVATHKDVERLMVAQARIDARLDGMVENDRRLLEIVQNQGANLSDMMKMLASRGAGA